MCGKPTRLIYSVGVDHDRFLFITIQNKHCCTELDKIVRTVVFVPKFYETETAPKWRFLVSDKGILSPAQRCLLEVAFELWLVS